MRYIKGLLILLSLLIISCAQDIGDIDRVQPNYHKKSFFDGEWYTRSTVVDVPYSTDFTFVGSQGDTSLITWDIQEKYLIGYRTYEHNPGSEAYLQKDKEFGTVCKKNDQIQVLGYNENCPDGYELVSKKAFKGTPIIAYRIKKHFDIIRRYNTTTGEQSNVIVEDTQDNEWYDRKYIRVDWSKNLIKDFRFGSVARIPSQGISYYCSGVIEPNDTHCNEWKPVFEKDENGNGTYFAIVGKLLAEPSTFDYDGRKYPACYLSGKMDCLGQEITYKTDFYKKKTKFYGNSGVNYDDNKLSKFGFFRTDKFVYDKDRGFLEDELSHKANIFNIFIKRDDGVIVDAKPIIYYVNKDLPKELMSSALKLASGFEVEHNGQKIHRKGWNDVFKNVVKTTLNQEYERCQKEELDNCEEINYLINDDMFIVCSNPVTETDKKECGEVGLSPRIGDLRYNMIFWVRHPQASSPLGFGPLAADPVSGETISANAFIYGDVLDGYAQYVLDLVDLINGDINVRDYISGKYVADYFNKTEEEESENENTQNKALLPNFSTNNSFNTNIENIFDSRSILRDEFNQNQLNDFNNMLSDKIENIKQAAKDGRLNKSSFTSRLNTIKGSSLESTLMNQDIKNMLSQSSVASVDWLNPNNLEQEMKLKELLAKKTIMMGDFIDDALLGTAKFLANKGWSKEQMYQYIREQIFLATTLHEIGHNLGLRHNFAGHGDALNFFPEYWDIRLENATSFKVEPAKKPQGGKEIPANIGLPPRYLETKAQIKSQMEKGVTNYQYSSIMDYGGKANSDFQGLGLYDEAAIMFGYANKVQVYDNKLVKNKEWEYKDAITEETSFAPVNWGEKIYRNMHYSRLLYAMIKVKGGGEYSHYIPLDYVTNKKENISMLYDNRIWVDYRKVLYDKNDSKVKENKAFYLKDKNSNDGLIEVPYAFCSDEYNGGMAKCYRFALGADIYESVMNQIDSYENYYFITNFYRGKNMRENSGSYMGRVFSKLEFVANQYKFWVLKVLIRGNQNSFNRYFGEDLTIAAIKGFNFLTRVLGSIEPGFYKEEDGLYKLSRKKDYLNNWDEAPKAGEVEVKLGTQGKFQDTIYDPDLGYSYYETPVVQGVWLDKIVAMEVIGNDRTDFLGVDAGADSASYAISYNMIFGNDVMRIMSGLLLDRPEYYAPFYYKNKFYNSLGLVRTGIFRNKDNEFDDFSGIREIYEQHNSEFVYFDVKNPFYIKYYAALLGLISYNSINTMDFGKSMDIGVIGNEDAFTPFKTFDDLPVSIKNKLIRELGNEADAKAKWENALLIVEDPITHRKYYSVNLFALTPSSQYDSTVDKPLVSIGYEMLKDYKKLVDEYNAAKASGDNQKFEEARAKLRDNRNFLDWVMKLLNLFKHPEF